MTMVPLSLSHTDTLGYGSVNQSASRLGTHANETLSSIWYSPFVNKQIHIAFLPFDSAAAAVAAAAAAVAFDFLPNRCFNYLVDKQGNQTRSNLKCSEQVCGHAAARYVTPFHARLTDKIKTDFGFLHFNPCAATHQHQQLQTIACETCIEWFFESHYSMPANKIDSLCSRRWECALHTQILLTRACIGCTDLSAHTWTRRDETSESERKVHSLFIHMIK